MEIPYTPVKYKKSSFNCPHCKAFADMRWDDSYEGYRSQNKIAGLTSAHCHHCGKYSLWIADEIIFPLEIMVDGPNKDLPQEIQEDYLEAANILNNSSRGSAALLRLSIEKLVDHLKAEGKDLNEKIGYLVTKGLSSKIQKALDVVRVVGNNAVHPGQIDLMDDIDIARNLFRLVNIISEEMITKPNEVNDIFEELVPEKQKNGITRRDSK